METRISDFRKAIFIGLVILVLGSPIQAATIYSQDFNSISGYTVTNTGTGNWGVGSLESSGFSSGGSQSGNIFFGSSSVNGGLSRSVIEFPSINLSDFRDISLSVSFAGSIQWWENWQADGVYIYINDSLIDSFRSNLSSHGDLKSTLFTNSLNTTFADYSYILNMQTARLWIEFASTDPTEKIGLDSITITGESINPVPLPPSNLLLATGLIGCFGYIRWKLRLA